MATGNRREAFGAYYFAVEIDGVQDAFFRSCGGLKSEAEVVPLAEGGVNHTTWKLKGRVNFPNIVLKQGFSSMTLWNLHRQCVGEEGNYQKRFSGSIIQYGPGQERVATWRFTDGWISKWEGPDFDASKNEISIESIEIAHNGLSAG